jgi:hypothetical protein
MRGRVHLGATYYYFWSIPALLGTDPRLAYAFAGLLGVGAVAGAFLLGRRIGGSSAGNFAALLLATTPAAVIDSRIAWAPAAIPPLAAAVLLLCHALLRRPTLARAAATAATATFATQLHLATAPLVLAAAASALARRRAIGGRGLLVAAIAAAVPLLPMAAAWRLDAGDRGPMAGDVRSASGGSARTASRSEVSTRDPTAGRIADLVLVSGRMVEGYSPPREERASLLSAWAAVERVALPVALAGVLAAAAAALRRGASREDSPLPELVAFLGSIAAVAMLPAEAWYYYLDTALVPGCVLLGVAATRPGTLAAVFRLVLVAAVALRVASLLLWLATGPATGALRVNLEWLRLGGVETAQLAGRARLPTLAVKEAAARAIVGDLGIPPEAVRSRVHGAAFADLDTDNGFFFARSSRRGEPPRESCAAPTHALAVYADELPERWLEGFAAPRRVGPLAIYGYEPVLETEAARIRDCDEAPAVQGPPGDPRDYGFGVPELPVWPCAPGELELDVPVGVTPPGTAVRAFARVQGAARVVALASEPAGTAIATAAPGAGTGLELPRDARRLTVRLRVDGPAALDLYELHGAPGASG